MNEPLKNSRKKVYFIPFILLFVFLFNLSVFSKTLLIPSGKTVGIKMYTDGLIVTETVSFKDIDGNMVCPASESNIKKGDVIKSVNGVTVNTCEQFADLIDNTPLKLEISSDNENTTATVTPRLSENGSFCLGLLLRDSTAGIGTITCINPDSLQYYALGHAVCDVDTGNIMTVNKGFIHNCNNISFAKGHIGFPGAVSAEFTDEVLGTLNNNTVAGISGKFETDFSLSAPISTALYSEITDGNAFILTDILTGTPQKYTVTIKKLSQNGEKNMIVTITDEKLISATGGIIQGMSGSPILQNGKIVGAVTHVFVNDPTRGYGIFIENMLAEAEKIK